MVYLITETLQRSSWEEAWNSPHPFVMLFGSKEWETEKNEKKEWKCVHVYDAPILCDWINSCPVVAAWLAEKILESKNLEFKTVLGAWNSFAKYTNPELSHELFLTGRDKKKKDFY